MRLPCNHIYHDSCLDSWVTYKVRCPLCIYDLMEGFDPAPTPARQPQQRRKYNRELFRRIMLERRPSRGIYKKTADYNAGCYGG